MAIGPFAGIAPEEVRAFVGMFLAQQQAQPRIKFQLAVTLKADNQLIGNCGIRMDAPGAHRADIGYELAPQHWGQGYATEAARAIVAVGDESVAMGGLRSMLTRGDHRGNGERMSLKEASRAASREAERELILKVLTRTRWNRRRAAQELQISYKALLYKLKQIGYTEYGAS